MFSAKGYCTHSSCFPVFGAPFALVFLCETHCQHMLCYKHWLIHQTNHHDDQPSIDNMLSSRFIPSRQMQNNETMFEIVSLDSDDEDVPDLLKECTNHQEHYPSDINCYVSLPLVRNEMKNDDHAEYKEMVASQPLNQEIEWWNEITPWKNTENFNIIAVLSDEDIEYDRQADDSDYLSKETRKITKNKLSQSITSRSYCGPCPLTFDGAFGLTFASHQLQLCPPSSTKIAKEICLYQHFHSKHGFTRAIAIRLVQAMIRRQDPYRTHLFSPILDTPSTLFDPYHKVKCPLAASHNLPNTPCLTQEISRKSMRRHLLRVHRLNQETVSQLIKDMVK